MDETQQTPPAALEGHFRSPSESDSKFRSTYADRKTPQAQTLPSYSPPLYSQTLGGGDAGDMTTVLPFREFNNAAELPPIQFDGSPRQKALPSISTVTGSSSANDSRLSSPLSSVAEPRSFSPARQSQTTANTTNHWPSLNPLTAYYTPGHVQSADSPLRMDVDSSSTASTTGRAGSVSLDDPDVRLAAEALGDLRADFVSSPPNRHSNLPAASTNASSSQSEPLLSLLTTSHPLLAKTIEGTTSAYNSSKNFSPRFKSSAEYVEGYLTPIGNTIGSVSRATGVEGGVRWFLGGRRQRHQHPTSAGEGDAGKGVFYKRRKMDLGRRGRSTGSAAGIPESQNAATTATVKGALNSGASPRLPTADRGDIFEFNDDRRLSMSTVETLPAYDDHRSPAYSESVDNSMQLETTSNSANARQQQISGPTAWQSRLIMSTSGLSIAMSEESLRSLKYCLNWLRWANGHIDKVITTLKDTLEQFDAARPGSEETVEDREADGNRQAAAPDRGTQEPGEDGNGPTDADRNELAARIDTLRGDVLNTLKGVVSTVSKYAGGALPDNARVLVHRHLTSLPQRFRLASQETNASASTEGVRQQPASDKDVREGAQRVLVLAKEGLDMMSQVSGVLDGTIVSAEEWCERLGRKTKRSDQPEQTISQPAAITASAESSDDVVMQQ